MVPVGETPAIVTITVDEPPTGTDVGCRDIDSDEAVCVTVNAELPELAALFVSPP